VNIQIYGHCLENKESVVFNFERGSSDLPDTSNGVAESISSVIVNGFFFKGYLSNEFPSPFNGGSTVWHCLMEREEFGRKRACLLICGWFEEESTEPITVADGSAWSRLTAIEINTTTFFFSLQMLECNYNLFCQRQYIYWTPESRDLNLRAEGSGLVRAQPQVNISAQRDDAVSY